MYAEIIVDVLSSAIDKVFDYHIPDDMNLSIGMRVLLPFGNRKIEGYCINIKESTDYDLSKVKDIIKTMDIFPLILPEFVELSYYLKDIYHLRLLDTIRVVIPSELRSGDISAKLVKEVEIGENKDYVIKKNAKKQLNAVEYVKTNGKQNYTELCKLFSNPIVNKLAELGVFAISQKQENRLIMPTKVDKVVTLNDNQNLAYQKIINCVGYKTFLLYGVTGSGKTEVYLNIIKNCLDKNKTALMLVPEIALTPQMVKIFTSRFGDLVAVLHSGLSKGEKFDEWNRIYNKTAKIVIGARSGIFAPLVDIGAIIIDEEHDSSYLSDSNPRYLTHKIAEFRAKKHNCPLILGSATPSVESFKKAKEGEYELLTLPKRANNKPMPNIEIVDMGTEFRLGNNSPFSNVLIDKLTTSIKNKNQAILFINRRGFSSFLMCRECGYIPKCVSCDVSLCYHKEDKLLKCHYCGKKYKPLTICPNCKSNSIKLGGIGTEKVVEDCQALFPDVKIFRLDNDTTKNKNDLTKIVDEFSKTMPAILVGTQMVSKGHDFEKVDLVGILDADLSLFFNDYRANEKTFQLITQVSGRAGRSKDTGSVVLQTYFPKNFVYRLCANYDFEKFFDKEINLRETTLYPPFSKIVRILITSEFDDLAKGVGHNIYSDLLVLKNENLKHFYFLEAMKSPISMIKNKYRYQIVTRFSNIKEKLITDSIFQIIEKYQGAKVNIFVETNPLSLS